MAAPKCIEPGLSVVVLTANGHDGSQAVVLQAMHLAQEPGDTQEQRHQQGCLLGNFLIPVVASTANPLALD